MIADGNWHSLDINTEEYAVNDFSIYSKRNELITFQSSDLVRFLRSNRRRIPTIIDLECFDKQMSQEGKEFRSYNQWKAITFLKHHNVIDYDFEFKESNFQHFLTLLAKVYISLAEENPIELARFNSIERKVNAIIYDRQYKGIRINIDAIKQKCIDLEKEIYRIKNILQHTYRIYDPDNSNQQVEYLNSKRYRIISNPKETFKIRRLQDTVCNLFYELKRNSQDLESCTFMLSHWGGENITYPSYFGFGTITSRITMRQPSLQNLRRSNRTVVIPDNGFRFLYVDYSQFEAGILASISDDDRMIALYNDDIYTDLARQVLRDGGSRDEAKILFYRYMYGDDSLDMKTKQYFSTFTKLDILKGKIHQTVTEQKRIGTSQGNFRKVHNDESTWSLSHLIQATASLIYKNAVIRTHEEVPSADFLIPMHDGTLYQIKNSEYIGVKAVIEKIYEDEFKKICPKLNPRVNSTDTF